MAVAASCQAFENESVVSLLRLTGPAREGVFYTISSIAENGTLKQRKELVESGAIAYVAEALRTDAGNAGAWAALCNLIYSTSKGRQQALENNVAALLPAGLKAGGLAASYTMDTMTAIAGSEEGAQAVASAGVIDAVPWPSLPAAKPLKMRAWSLCCD